MKTSRLSAGLLAVLVAGCERAHPVTLAPTSSPRYVILNERVLFVRMDTQTGKTWSFMAPQGKWELVKEDDPSMQRYKITELPPEPLP